MTRMHQRLQRLEAQAWEVEGRRLAQMTEAELDAEIVRLEAHAGASIQDYECFVETLSASELEALGTADLATMQRFLHAFQLAEGTAAHEPATSLHPCGPPRSPARPCRFRLGRLVIVWMADGDTRATALQKAGWTPAEVDWQGHDLCEYEETRSDALSLHNAAATPGSPPPGCG